MHPKDLSHPGFTAMVAQAIIPNRIVLEGCTLIVLLVPQCDAFIGLVKGLLSSSGFYAVIHVLSDISTYPGSNSIAILRKNNSSYGHVMCCKDVCIIVI